MLYKVVLTWNPSVWLFKWKILGSTFMWYCLLCSGADPENSERGGKVHPPPPPFPLNKNFTFQDMQHTALWACSWCKVKSVLQNYFQSKIVKHFEITRKRRAAAHSASPLNPPMMLYKVVLVFKSVYETLVCDHWNESYWAVLSCGTVYYAVQSSSPVLNLWMKP